MASRMAAPYARSCRALQGWGGGWGARGWSGGLGSRAFSVFPEGARNEVNERHLIFNGCFPVARSKAFATILDMNGCMC